MFTRQFFLFFLTAALSFGQVFVPQAQAQEVTAGQTNREASQFSSSLDALKRFVEAKINHLQSQVTANTSFRTTLAQNGCADGQYLAAVDENGNTTCRTDQTGSGAISVAGSECPAGYAIFGFEDTGALKCRDLGDGGSGNVNDDAINDYFNNMRTGTVASTGCNGYKGQGCVTVSRQIATGGTHCFVNAERMDATYRYNSFYCQYNKATGILTAHGKPNAQHSAMGTVSCRYFCPRGSAPANMSTTNTGSSTGNTNAGGTGGTGSSHNNDYFGFYEDLSGGSDFNLR